MRPPLRLTLMAAAVGFWSLRCGSIDQTARSVLPDAGTIGADGGTGADAGSDAGPGGGTLDAGIGGAPDAGSGPVGGADGGTVTGGSGGGGVADAGSGSGGAGGGGSGSGDSGGSSGGTGDGGSGAGDSGGGGSGGGGTGGGVAAGCEGIVPDSLGTPVTAGITPDDSNQQCWSSTSDESGNVAMEAHPSDANAFLDAPRTSQVAVHWFLFRPDGSKIADAPISYGLFPQGSGFNGVYWRGGPAVELLRHWSADGQVHDNEKEAFGHDEAPALMARTFREGVVTAGVSISQGGATSSAALTLTRYDGAGNQESRISKPIPVPGAVVGVAEAAAFARPAAAFLMPRNSASQWSGDLYVFWTDLDPAPSGGLSSEEKVIATGVDPANFVAHPLLDGTLAVRINGAWAVLKPFETTLTPAPPWLADHPDHDFTIVRGERAYALIQSGRNSLELVSKQGSSCGTVTFPDVGGVTSGADGTVIGASGPGGCTKKWWSGLLR